MSENVINLETPCWMTLGIVVGVGLFLSFISGPLSQSFDLFKERRITTMTTLYVLILVLLNQIPSWHFHVDTNASGRNVLQKGKCYTDFKTGFNILYALYMLIIGYASFYLFSTGNDESTWNFKLFGSEVDLTSITMMFGFIILWLFVPRSYGGLGLSSLINF
jgi:hypothetical protein